MEIISSNTSIKKSSFKDRKFKNQSSSFSKTQDSNEEFEPKKIYVGNIPYDITKEEVIDFFKSHNCDPVDCYIPRNDEGNGRGFCLIKFDS